MYVSFENYNRNKIKVLECIQSEYKAYNQDYNLQLQRKKKETLAYLGNLKKKKKN